MPSVPRNPQHSLSRRLGALLRCSLAAAVATTAFVVGPSPAVADTGSCDRFASPGGSDQAAGTVSAPFASAGKLVSVLRPGETGCLRAGTYEGKVVFWSGGTQGSPVTLTSYPGETVTVKGRLDIVEGADHVRIVGLRLDGRHAERLPSPVVHGDDVTFLDNDVTTYNTAICFSVGALGWDDIVAERLTLQGNRIHDCGPLPATNQGHAIYLEQSSGARIIDNWIYDNADRGIQLYPSAQGTTIEGNVIDGNGQNILFSGVGGRASSNNVVRHNVITNAVLRANVESWYPAGNPQGTGNVVTDNCIHGGVRIFGDNGGFAAFDNLLVAPGYVDRAAKDFRLRPGSACQAILDGSAPSTPAPAPEPTPAPPPVPAPAPALAPAPAPVTPADGATAPSRSLAVGGHDR